MGGFFKFYSDVGLVAWVCLLFGIMIFLAVDWSQEEYRLHLLFGLVALLYGWGRVRIVFDKREILEAIEKMEGRDEG